MTNCLKCSNMEDCEECDSGYDLIYNTSSKHYECSVDSKIERQGNRLLACTDGYYGCVSCAGFGGCNPCNTERNFVQYRYNGAVLGVRYCYPLRCASYDFFECFQCEDYFFMYTTTYDSVCCPNGCTTCVKSGTCDTVCKSDHYSYTDSGYTYCCPNGCTSCTNSGTCPSCKAGLHIYDSSGFNYCCPDGCNSCSESGTCPSCKSGWHIYDSSGFKYCCPDGCVTYSQSGTCTTCRSDHYKYTSSGLNLCCPKGCDSCSESGTCSECKSGWYLYDSSDFKYCCPGVVLADPEELKID